MVVSGLTVRRMVHERAIGRPPLLARHFAASGEPFSTVPQVTRPLAITARRGGERGD